MEKLDERLLREWLRIFSTVQNIRLESKLTHNEMLVCYSLFCADRDRPGATMTPTEIAHETKIRPSQVNRNLNQLEKREMITRTRSATDHRRVDVSLNVEHEDPFLEERSEVLGLVDLLVERLGRERAEQACELLAEVSGIIESEFPLDAE